MIEKGDMIVLETEDAIYKPCEVVSVSATGLQVKFRKPEWDTRCMCYWTSESWKTEVIKKSKIVSIQKLD